jgi:heme oxygenase
MLVRLGLETASHHTCAEEHRLAAMDIKTNDQYRAFLSRIYGLEAPVEAAVWAYTELGPRLLHERDKAGRIRDDLLELGLSESDVESLPRATVTVRSVAHALGWLFVLERHTLLAGLIRRHVQYTLGDVGVRYLGAYGETPGARFRELGEELCRYAGWCMPRSIVTGANEAFRTQRLWYAEASSAARTRVESSNGLRPLVADDRAGLDHESNIAERIPTNTDDIRERTDA